MMSFIEISKEIKGLHMLSRYLSIMVNKMKDISEIGQKVHQRGQFNTRDSFYLRIRHKLGSHLLKNQVLI